MCSLGEETRASCRGPANHNAVALMFPKLRAKYGSTVTYEQSPASHIIVEFSFDVVQAADESGSTDFIIRTVKASPPGSTWAVGTEIHLVNRLAREVAPERTVLTLDSVGCLCSTMFRISPNHLLWTLDGLIAGEVRNRIVVPEPTRGYARVALERMLECRP
jgi:quinolinate synthase